MSIRDNFFDAQAKASLWDVAVSIKRGNPLPLDANAVYASYGTIVKTEVIDGVEKHTYTAGSLLEYAKTNPVAYPGQICAVVDVDATTIYYLDQNLEIQPVGIIPTGDDKTIEVTTAGAISLLGASTATNGTLPMIDSETGKLVWKTLEDIGAGDGNDNTTYTFELGTDGTSFVVTPLFNGQPIFEGEGEEKVQVKTTISLDVYTKKEVDEAIDEAVKGILGEDVQEAYDTLKEIQDILEGTDGEKIDGLIETVDANKQAIDVLNGTGEGSVDKAISDALEDYYTSNEIDGKGFAVATDVERDYAKKATTLAGYGITDAYTATQTDNAIAAKIKEMTGGESAADVLLALNNYKASNDREVWGDEFVTKHTSEGVYTPDYSGNSRVDELKSKLDTVEEGAEVNVIEIVKVNGTALTPDSDRAVNVVVPVKVADLSDGSALELAVENNTKDIEALEVQIHGGTVDGQTVKGIISRLSAVETEVGVVEASRIDSLEGIVGDENNGLVKIVAGHTSELSTLKNQTLVLMQEQIDGKVAQGAFDTLNAKVDIGDKKVSEYVAGEIAKIPAYDDSNVVAAIENIYKPATGTPDGGDYVAESGVLVTEISRVEGLISALAGKDNTSTVKANADAIALLNGTENTEGSVKHTVATELAKIISDTDADIDTLNEIADWIINDTTGAAKMANDIATLNTKVDTGDKKVSEYVAEAIANAEYTLPVATATVLGGVKSAQDVEGKVVANKMYVDATTNIGEVKAISTDLLVQGEFELILNGGNAGLN